MATLSFMHAGNIGDVWASLLPVKQAYIKTGKKAILYLFKGQKTEYYPGATHPTTNEKGEHVMLNEEVINMMLPLLKEQEYIEDARIFNDEHIDVDLNAIRDTPCGVPNFHLSMWYMFIFADLYADISQQWIDVPDSDKDLAKGKIVINRTQRYISQLVDYRFLKEYEDQCVFIGTMREYNNFCIDFDLNIPKLHVNTFLEFAQAIKQSRFYMGNQSQGFQLAEGLKHPRICELYGEAPNVLPVGKDAYGFLDRQIALENYFHTLNGTYEQYLYKLRILEKERLLKNQEPVQL